MEKKKAPNFIIVIIAIIVGSALYKQIDFENLTVEKPALSIIYLIVFLATVYMLVKSKKSESEK